MELNGKSWFDGGKAESIRKVAGAVVLLLAAVGIGMVIREFRFRSAGEKHVAEAPRAVRPAEVVEVQDVEEELPVEEVIVEAEAIEPEPVRAAESVPEADVESDAGVSEEMAAEPVEDDPKVKEKRARAALAMIGYDPAADEVWLEVINDPSMSDNARSNLIEDLNEDGFPDKNNPTVDDLPMIEYRIDLIDDHAPYAMDKTNADAFKEARKDLVNMVNRLTR